MSQVDYGEPPKRIPGLHSQVPDCFQLTQANTKHSSHDIVIENNQWQDVHSKIQGEFYDKEFPAEKKSLVGTRLIKDDDSAAKLQKLEAYDFKRLSYVLKTVEVIKDGISPTDIYQGALGDCYYMSAIASIAEYPDRIKRNILQRKTSPKGAYCVALNIVGAWVQIVLDDIFPVNSSGSLVFCYTKEKEIWAMLLEKAYAKAYGAYWHIGAGGQTGHAMKDLTGAPTEYINLEDAKAQSSALASVMEADKNHYVITCSSKGQGEHKNPDGIISGHAYTLASVHKLSNG